jgi:hypothetical protein
MVEAVGAEELLERPAARRHSPGPEERSDEPVWRHRRRERNLERALRRKRDGCVMSLDDVVLRQPVVEQGHPATLTRPFFGPGHVHRSVGVVALVDPLLRRVRLGLARTLLLLLVLGHLTSFRASGARHRTGLEMARALPEERPRRLSPTNGLGGLAAHVVAAGRLAAGLAASLAAAGLPAALAATLAAASLAAAGLTAALAAAASLAAAALLAAVLTFLAFLFPLRHRDVSFLSQAPRKRAQVVIPHSWVCRNLG